MTNMTDIVAPHDDMLEAALIAACIIEQNCIDDVTDIIDNGAAFYNESHRAIWNAIYAIHKDGADVDSITLRTELSRVGKWDTIGGAAGLSQILDSITSGDIHPIEYAKKIDNIASRRTICALAGLLSSSASDMQVKWDQLSKLINNLRDTWESRGRSMVARPASEIIKIQSPGNEWLIQEWWSARACGWLSAHEKSCKSILAVSIALSVSNGIPWLFKWTAIQGRVLYVAAEDDAVNMAHRIRQIASAIGADVTPELIVACQGDDGTHSPICDISSHRGRQKLLARIRQDKPILVILDTLRRCAPGLDENNSSEVSDVLGWLRRIQAENHCGIMIVHHWRKQMQGINDKSMDSHRMRGSGDMGAWYDSQISVRRDESEDPDLAVLRIAARHRYAADKKPQEVRVQWGDHGKMKIWHQGEAPKQQRLTGRIEYHGETT